MSFVMPFGSIRHTDVALVGGKNASLGEMFNTLTSAGIRIPDGFAVTASAYRYFLSCNQLPDKLQQLLDKLDTDTLENLPGIGAECRALIREAVIPADLGNDILAAYQALNPEARFTVAVRSSATAEDLPEASFAGQHESFLNVGGGDELLHALQNCYVSLFTDRAIKYRLDNGFAHMQVALAIAVQRMVRADLGSAGVAFTIDPDSGNEQVVYITSAWGLGENVVQGAVIPDEFYVFKPAIGLYPRPIVHRRMGAKELKMIYSEDRDTPLINVETTQLERNSYSLDDHDVQMLGIWCLHIEKHYGMPMDVEWARDGHTQDLFVVQARPVTVTARKQEISIKQYDLRTCAKPLCKGKAVGRAIVSGRACIVHSLADAGKVQLGDIIVADVTNPDWNAMLRRAASIVTNKGGRTSHASIVARELGIHAVVGTGDATTKLHDGQIITVACCEGDEGRVFDGRLDWDETSIDVDPSVPTRTKAMLILANPGRAFSLARYPNQGVGLLRMEFIITNTIRIHPMALAKFAVLPDSVEKQAIEAITRHQQDKKQYFIERLSEAVGLVAAAFYPREVIVRMSDFKTNEYAQLLGGKMFEPEEENPMLGFRGASRYYHPNYREGFGLECEAMRVIRDEMGLINVKLMIPFCRTVEEGRKVLATMASFGLKQGVNGLEVYVMVEMPSNVILAKQFAEIFDGFSIGSNDLTQLTLGIDRDSASISELFDENNPAVKQMLSMVIREAKAAGVKIGLCGQAPSDYPGFARFLVEAGIDNISFNSDALLKGIKNIQAAEAQLASGDSKVRVSSGVVPLPDPGNAAFRSRA